MKKLLTILAVLVGCSIASAQEFEETLIVYYRPGSAWFIPQDRDNGIRAKEFFRELQTLQNVHGAVISSMELVGSCSPDGTKEYNDFLGNRRCMLFYERFSTELGCPIDRITFRNETDEWGKIAEYTALDKSIGLRREAVRIIKDGNPGIIGRLESLDRGYTYRQIVERIYPDVRTVTVKVTLKAVEKEQPEVTDIVVVEPEQVKVKPQERVVKKKTPVNSPMALSLKTNAAAWLIGVSNIALECDVTHNFAINLPVYYSGWDRNIFKFNWKGLVIQPEVRYYIPKVNGLYAGVHLGLAWFNCHGGGDYRYQNSGWKRPTYGGGVNVGYRMPLKKNTGWKVEFGLGAGIYDVQYDVFYNEANGPYMSRNQYSMYYGIDQAYISFLYSFKLGRKEGRK